MPYTELIRRLEEELAATEAVCEHKGVSKDGELTRMLRDAIAAIKELVAENEKIERLRFASDAGRRQERHELSSQVRGLCDALHKIERWELPPTGKLHRGQPTTYAFEYGSNGERDFMREIARSALAYRSTPAQPWQKRLEEMK